MLRDLALSIVLILQISGGNARARYYVSFSLICVRKVCIIQNGLIIMKDIVHSIR